jgi:hypothetical protein
MPPLARSWENTKAGVRRHVFRTWTACAILAAYVYGWVYVPEWLIWWKRTTTAVIEAGCSLLPYPWNDRIEATLGNIGLWVQITLAIIVFRILVWLVMSAFRGAWSIRDRRPQRAMRAPAEDPS